MPSAVMHFYSGVDTRGFDAHLTLWHELLLELMGLAA